MNYQLELSDHNSRNMAILEKMVRMLGVKKLTPAQLAEKMGAIARFKALVIKPVPVGSSETGMTEAQHQAAYQLAGMFTEERKLALQGYQLEREAFN